MLRYSVAEVIFVQVNEWEWSVGHLFVRRCRSSTHAFPCLFKFYGKLLIVNRYHSATAAERQTDDIFTTVEFVYHSCFVGSWQVGEFTFGLFNVGARTLGGGHVFVLVKWWNWYDSKKTWLILIQFRISAKVAFLTKRVPISVTQPSMWHRWLILSASLAVRYIGSPHFGAFDDRTSVRGSGGCQMPSGEHMVIWKMLRLSERMRHTDVRRKRYHFTIRAFFCPSEQFSAHLNTRTRRECTRRIAIRYTTLSLTRSLRIRFSWSVRRMWAVTRQRTCVW